jgi:hypothetical protein
MQYTSVAEVLVKMWCCQPLQVAKARCTSIHVRCISARFTAHCTAFVPTICSYTCHHILEGYNMHGKPLDNFPKASMVLVYALPLLSSMLIMCYMSAQFISSQCCTSTFR